VAEGEETGKEGRVRMFRMLLKRGEEAGRGGEAADEEAYDLPTLTTAQHIVRSFLYHKPCYVDCYSSFPSFGTLSCPVEANAH
jgi:hypothetical protein